MKGINVQEIAKVVEPVVTGAGYELADLDFCRERGGWTLRLFIDRTPEIIGGPEPAAVGLEDCTKVSREVSATLDVHEVIPHEYTLEVSSPGLDRPLRKPDHFRRFTGKRAKIALKLGLDGRRNFSGTILGMSDDNQTITFETEDGKQFALPIGDLDKANLKYF